MLKFFFFLFLLIQSSCSSVLYNVKTDNVKQAENRPSDCVSYNSTAQINGVSMEPLIPDSSIGTILMGYYNCHAVEHGDIISFRFAVRKEAMIKRVVALPGDLVEIKKDRLFVNNKEVLNSISSPYFFNTEEQKWLLYNVEEGRLTKDRFLVLSDRTENPYDSRKFGSVFRNQIEGKLLLETVRKL